MSSDHEEGIYNYYRDCTKRRETRHTHVYYHTRPCSVGDNILGNVSVDSIRVVRIPFIPVLSFTPSLYSLFLNRKIFSYMYMLVLRHNM